MKRALFWLVTLIFLLFTFLANTFAQDSPQWHLPEGVKARLGKGSISGNIAYSPDGTRLAVASGIGIWLYDTAARQEVALLTGHTWEILSVAFSPDGTTLASGSSDQTVRLWEVNTGAPKRTLTGHTGGVRSVAFSPDGNTIVSGSNDQTVRLWDVNTGTHTRSLAGHTDWVFSVAFSPDGNTIASGSRDGTILLWELTPAPSQNQLDVNGDGNVNVLDFTLVASQFGQTGQNIADVNQDGTVDRQDILQMIDALEAAEGAPAAPSQPLSTLTAEKLQRWLDAAKQLNRSDPTFQNGIAVLERLLEQLLASPTPTETGLLSNYPNPFNPETWIPYHLANDANVTLTIYNTKGAVVRQLNLGHQAAGYYTGQSKAAYWDGRNASGESVASGVYFVTLTAGDYSATRRMVIVK